MQVDEPIDRVILLMDKWQRQELDHNGKVEARRLVRAMCEVPAVRTLRVALAQERRDNGLLIGLSQHLDEHPEGYEGPCLCGLCRSYVEV